ncbi:MAG: heme-binding protein [Comamonadaceae bacterium]|nr:MAG: heme-binding protein [Comamonadaceae bacterium]
MTDLRLDAPPPYGATITLSDAKRMMAAAEARAMASGWPVAIVIADASGGVLLAQKIDGTQHSAMGIATGKALTSVNFRRPTKMFQDGIAAGGEGLRFLAVPGVTPLEGGFPVHRDGRVVGGIGVSGVLSTQDSEVAQAGLAALG